MPRVGYKVSGRWFLPISNPRILDFRRKKCESFKGNRAWARWGDIKEQSVILGCVSEVVDCFLKSCLNLWGVLLAQALALTPKATWVLTSRSETYPLIEVQRRIRVTFPRSVFVVTKPVMTRVRIRDGATGGGNCFMCETCEIWTGRAP